MKEKYADQATPGKEQLPRSLHRKVEIRGAYHNRLLWQVRFSVLAEFGTAGTFDRDGHRAFRWIPEFALRTK